MHIINNEIKAEMPIAAAIYEVLWNGRQASEAFNEIETGLV
jgi:glycerol-3-phosphate dehydrogenase